MTKRKNENGSENASEKVRKTAVVWSQDETEAFCDLLLMHGTGAILNKTTNAATKEGKALEWKKITQLFSTQSWVIESTT